ncbi:MAG: AI-2E family transporter, partial [Litorivicinus sp.]
MELNDRSFTLINLAAVVVVIAGVKQAAPVVVPLLVSAFIAMIACPPVFWLERRNVPPVVAVLGVVSVIVGFATLISLVVAGSIDGFLQALPTYQARLKAEIGAIAPVAAEWGLPVDLKTLQDVIDPGAAMGLVSNLLSGLGNVLANGFLILLLVVFILLEASSLPSKIRTALRAPEDALQQFG